MASAYHLSRKLQKLALTELRETRLPQIGRVGGNVGVGKVFYVNGSRGSDSANGETPGNPFATITYALTKCTNRNDDTILVTRDTTEADYPVDINKRDIHILGWDNPTRMVAEKVLFNYNGDSAAFNVSEQNVEIAGFDLCGYTGASAAIELNTSVWNCSIHDCAIGMRGIAQDGIKITTAMPYLSIYDNYFGSAIERDGVRFEANATRGWVGLPGHGNVFDVPTIGIDAISSVGVTLGGMCNNVFLLSADTAGYAITFANSGASGCMIFGNQAFYGTSALSNNPYRDLGSNHWGLNYRQGVSILPATV